MKRFLLPTVSLILYSSVAWGQSALDGTSFAASIYNMPNDVGFVRLIDAEGSDCDVEGGPNGDDKPGEDVCFIADSGIPPVSITFGGGAQAVGDALVTPTVATFDGLPEGSIEVFNAATDTTAPIDRSSAGDILEFTIRTADDTYLARDLDEGLFDYWGFSATGMQYPNAAADSHVVLPFDEALGNYVNFYFWFETKDGPITSGYEVVLPVGLGVGPHPLDENREVLYPLYSRSQADDQVDTVAGGSIDFYSHGSILDENPEIGNMLVLSENTISAEAVADPLEEVTGVGFAFLVLPPEMTQTGTPGDFNDDGLLTAEDIDLLSAQVGGGDAGFDLNGDGSVTDDDRQTWMGLAGTLAGDADLNGTVEFADFLSLSAAFGNMGGWSEGDFDGTGEVEFADFLLLSGNFGNSAAPAGAAVPEPSASFLLLGGLLALLHCRRKSS